MDPVGLELAFIAITLTVSSFASAGLLWRTVERAIDQVRWAGDFETTSSDTQTGCLLLRNYCTDYRKTSLIHRGSKTLQQSLAN